MIMDLIKKHRDVMPYLFFGICTTIVNVIIYWVCAYPLELSTMLSTITAWIFSVLFAYVTNRKYVFHSNVHGIAAISKEIMYFFVCRLATGIVDWLCMYVFVDLIGINDLGIKVATNILVIILNYVASRLIIFKKGKDNE